MISCWQRRRTPLSSYLFAVLSNKTAARAKSPDIASCRNNKFHSLRWREIWLFPKRLMPQEISLQRRCVCVRWMHNRANYFECSVTTCPKTMSRATRRQWAPAAKQNTKSDQKKKLALVFPRPLALARYPRVYIFKCEMRLDAGTKETRCADVAHAFTAHGQKK